MDMRCGCTEWHRVLFLASLLMVPMGCSQASRVLEGQVFIVTRGGESIRLGLVPISLIPEAELRDHIRNRRVEIRRGSAEAQEKARAATQRTAEAEKALRAAKAADARMEDDYAAGRVTTEEWFARGSSSSRAQVVLAERQLEEMTCLAEVQRWQSPDLLFVGLPPGASRATTDADGEFQIAVPRGGRFALAAFAQREVFQATERYHWLLWIDQTTIKRGRILLNNSNLVTSSDSLAVLEFSR
jgi:hypothetical protein